MATSKAGGRTFTTRLLGPRCAAIPGFMRARRDVGRTKGELDRMAALAHAHGGLIPHSEQNTAPDFMANIWFMRAVHEFGLAAAGPDGQDFAYADFFATTLIPLCKTIIQSFISGDGIAGVRMDDGGMLAGAPTQTDALRINALWYAALASTAEFLSKPHNGKKDPAASHFDRLAGRFRRSFAKAYWCEEHGGICSPAAKAQENHAAHDHLEPDGLLVAILPGSPLPRTKQRQVLARVEKNAGKHGVKYKHPVHGEVESPLHQAWLARAFAMDSGGGAEGRTKAVALLTPLSALWEAAQHNAIHGCYQGGHGIGRPDPLASAEVYGALEQLLPKH